MFCHPSYVYFFFFNDTATTEIYTLSLHDALPISGLERPFLHGDRPGRRPYRGDGSLAHVPRPGHAATLPGAEVESDRKSTRLNSSHSQISYAVFCLKKKKKIKNISE